MPTPKTYIIINPNADRGNAWRLASDLRHIVDEFGKADWSGTVYPTHANKLARQAALDGFERIIAMGGDGTVHEVINGIMQAPPDQRPQVGIVPLGSGNDFSSAIGIKDDPSEALRQALSGKPKPIDLFRVEVGQDRREYVHNTMGIGFDTIVTIRTRSLSFVRGFMMYFTAVLQTIMLNHEAFHVEVETDQGSWQDDLLMLTLCNGPREGGGFQVAPEALPDDGILHYTAIRQVSRLMMLRLLPTVMNGTHGGYKPVTIGQVKRMKIVSDRPLYIHMDGEIFAGFGTNVRELQLDIVPKAIEIIV